MSLLEEPPTLPFVSVPTVNPTPAAAPLPAPVPSVYADDYHWVVATSEADATAVLRELGLSFSPSEEPEWRQCAETQDLTIDWGDGNSDNVPTWAAGWTGRVTKTCAEWTALIGRGFLCGDF